MISNLRWMLHIASLVWLTDKLHNKGALLNGLCSLDPPALVGGQEGFHQRRLQLIKWSAQQSQLVSVLAAACKAQYADRLDISTSAIYLSTNNLQITVSKPPLCDTLLSCRRHQYTQLLFDLSDVDAVNDVLRPHIWINGSRHDQIMAG